MNEIVTGFDYGSLDKRTSNRVQMRTTEIKNLARHCLEDMILIGQKLVEVKGLLDHGHFLSWLEKEFALSIRTAEKLMRLAKVFKNEDFSNLNIGISALNLIAAPSTPSEAREDVLNLACTDQGIKYGEVKDIVNRHKRERSSDSRDEVTKIPQSLQKLIDKGRIGLPLAIRIMRSIDEADRKTQLLVSQWGLSDPDLVPELDRLNKEGRETFSVILDTGTIPSPRGSIPIDRATLRDLSDYLNQASFEHAMVGIEAKKERDQAALKNKLVNLRGDSTDIIITDQLNDLASASDECVVLFSPGDHSPKTLGSLIEKWGYQHLALLLFKGNPPVNLGGRLRPASKASYRIPKPAKRLLEDFCDLAQFKAVEEQK